MRHRLNCLLLSAGLTCLWGASAFAQTTPSDGIVQHDNWWLPPQGGPEAARIDDMFTVIFVITTLTMIAVFAVLITFLIKYRYRPERRSTFIHGHHKAEVIWTVTPAVVLVAMGILSIRAWGQLRMDKPGPETPTTEIEVLAQQFQWNFRYPGRDGRFGTKDDIGTFDMNDQNKTPLIGTFRVPVNKVVRIHLMSKDVLHSFFLPNMRMKLDAVPGLRGELWFTPTQPGRFDLACAELCGPQHYTMRGELIVLPQAEYDAWMKERIQEVADALGEEAPAEESATPAEEKPESAETKPKAGGEPETAAPDASKKAAPGTAGEDLVVSETAEGGTIKGKVSFEGTPPKAKKVAVDVDAHCKKAHPGGIETQTVKVKDGGLADAFVQIKNGLPKDGKWDPPKEPVVLNQEGCEYHPHIFGIMAGQPLNVVNSDATSHNIHGFARQNSQFNFSQAQKGMEKTVELTKPEDFRIACDVHNWMNAHAFVMSHPFFATSDEQGNFTIKNVPPGSYDIEIWHESLGSRTIKGVKVDAAKGAQLGVKLSGKKK